MTDIDRRQFVGVTITGVSILSAGACARRSVLDARAVGSLAESVLPTEIGADGADRTARDFLDWTTGAVPGAELNHGYGTGNLSFTDPLPIDRWAEQLEALNTMAGEMFARSFTDASIGERQVVIRDALEAFPNARLGNPARAEHIAVGIMSFFCRSTEATDLAYRASIKKQQCRPLGESANRPIALG